MLGAHKSSSEAGLPLCQLFCELGTIWELAFALAKLAKGPDLGESLMRYAKRGGKRSLMLPKAADAIVSFRLLK